MNSLVLQRLTKLIAGNTSFGAVLIQNNTWQFSNFVTNQRIDFFIPLVRNHLLLTLEYQALGAQIVYYHQNSKPIHSNTLIAALAMNDLLIELYAHYLSIPREVNQLLADRAKITALLQQYYPEMEIPLLEVSRQTIRKFNSKYIRDSTADSNFPRLFIVRLKKWLNLLAPLIKSLEQYALFIVWLDKIANPIFSYLAWVFFLPRLLTNCYVMVCHLFPNKSSKEAMIPWLIRLEAHWQRRWFELGNDSVWMIAGLLSCFILIGHLSPIGFYMTLALYAYDVELATIRAFVELNRLYHFKNHYRQLCFLGNQDDYLVFLEQRVRFEEKRLLLAVVNTSVLMLAMFLLTPVAIMTHPAVPLAGVSLLVATTVVHYLLLTALEKQRPVSNLNKIKISPKVSFFANKNSANNDSTQESEYTVTI